MNHLTHLGRAQWSSPMNYLLVTIGAIVGIGNVLQFPFLVFQYGGLFILLYFLCEIAIALPLLLAELTIGRRGKQNPVGAFEILSLESGGSPYWRWAGWICVATSFLTLSYYAVSAAFPVGYLFKSAALAYTQSVSPLENSSLEGHLTTNFFQLEICFILFLGFVMLVINRGINRGLESISRIVVPLYFFILLVLAIYTCITGNFSGSLHHLVAIPANISFMTVFFAALIFSFFKLGVGMGSMIIYGSYLPHSVRLGRSTLIIIGIDAVIALLAYFVIFPLIFTLSPGALGDKLTNYNVIFVFTHIPHGLTVAVIFFFAATLMAWTPMIAMAETVTATLVERFNILRRSATLMISAPLLLLGTIEILFRTTLIDEKLVGHLELYSILRIFTSNMIAPISALLTAIFAGWIIKKLIFSTELKFKPTVYKLWLFSVRYLTPLMIVLIFVWNFRS